ncbi:metal ABC transporter substrate-binding protein [Halomonas shantousis]
MRKAIALFMLGTGVVALTPAQAAEPLDVVASFSILGDMVERVGGSHVAVKTLVGPEGDAHVYSPSPSDARALASADLVVINGLQFEGWMERLIDASGYTGPRVVASQGVAPLGLDEDGHAAHDDHDDHDGHDHHHDESEHAHAGHDHGSTDPHAWQDLERGEQYVINIRNGLIEADPEHAADYRANAAQYVEEIQALDAEIRERLGEIPAEHRTVITGHDAFGYFSQAYGVDFLAPVGVSTEAEPSAADMARLIQQIRERDVRALFLESMSNPAMIQQIRQETGVTVGGTLYADTLAKEGEASTYLGMFRHNVRMLHDALSQRSE